MSAPVDVLAVVRTNCPAHVVDAVAELIEANVAEYRAHDAYAAARGAADRNATWRDVQNAIARRRAALARCQGGAA